MDAIILPAETDQNRTVLQSAAALEAAGEKFVMVTVIRTQGRTPRNTGAKLIWRPDTPAIGTIGGGAVEELVFDEAAKHYEMRGCGTSSHILGQEAEQCCGGRMEFFYEYFGPTHRLVIFGAGHVAHALVGVLSGLRFEIVIVDDRPQWNCLARFPQCKRILNFDEGLSCVDAHADQTCVCIMTYSHETDFDILSKLLEKPPLYTGLIGSQSKRACFVGRLMAQGFSEAQIESMTCPMGLGRGGKHPRAVAISIASELLHITGEAHAGRA